ncbi:ATP-dependent DNA helicase CHL1 [Vairimorpha necatrix]|uniref:ATP-dependent DNA helicase CHL1 n=1 Tax=Vairimorpha necatrix TaxID=6039 RepID=A0AAX4J8H6_9MICR
MVLPDLYNVQKEFIKDCKSIINNSEIGIFSSPTGTGKTLSLLLSIVEYITEFEEEDDLLIEHILGKSSKTKIYFSSRTHSQLKQCLAEFKKIELRTNSVILGSRKIYCVNREVDNKEEIDKVNQKCRDLVKNEKCEFYKKDMFLSGIFDIEELVREGRKNGCCPYYFNKEFYKKCEIVFLPYNLLFSEESRNNLNINLYNSIVIIDEAHNIIETVNNINTKIVYFENMEKYNFAFKKYLKILPSKSKSKNCILKIIEILEILLKYKNSQLLIKDVNNFLFESDLLHFNMLDLVEDLTTNNIPVKIESYGKFLNNKIYEIIKFLTLLVNSDTNCKVEISSKFIKIFPVDSKLYFEPFFDCQSVIFAGGTMEPIKPLQDIFNTRNIKYFSYDSVATDFRAFIIKNFNSKIFELTEKTRDTDFIQSGIVEIINKFRNSIKFGGIVVFLPSKYYLELLKRLLKDTEDLYFENYDMFEDYKKNVKNKRCLLFAVMGGRLSEGMNFNDDLCRVLIIFGVPFPNLTTEITEKIKYFGKQFLLENTIKKVNQTIGRAIRHKNDFASIFLIDSRYCRYKNELSPWFRNKCQVTELNAAIKDTVEFLSLKL